LLETSSFEEWLYRKANQNAHNEILALLIIVLGANFLMGGLVLTVIQTGELSFTTLIDPILLSKAIHMGFILTLAGFVVVSAGFILVIHYDREKSWYQGEIAKSTTFKKKKTKKNYLNSYAKEY